MFISCILCFGVVEDCYYFVILFLLFPECLCLSYCCYWMGYLVIGKDILLIESKCLL